MSARNCMTSLLIACTACLVLLVAQRWTEARQQEGAPSREDCTALGTPMLWPAGIDPTRINLPVAYSPSGRYLALTIGDDGHPLIVDLQENSACDLYEVVAPDLPNLRCRVVAWVTDERIYLGEDWITDSDRAELLDPETANDAGRVNAALDRVGLRGRVVDWVSGVTELALPIGADVSFDEVLAFEGEDQWVVRYWTDQLQRIWRFDATTRSATCVLAACSENESLRGVRGNWVIKFLAAKSARLWEQSLDVTLVNYQTGESHAVTGIPPILQALKITSDGRHMIAESCDAADFRCHLLVFNTLTGEAHDLAPTESWTPVAISESRGVLLALMMYPPENWNGSGWIEVPLSALFTE
jgi:hypothetical protein